MPQERKLAEKVPPGFCGCCKAADAKTRYVVFQDLEFLPDVMLKVFVAALEASLLYCDVPLSLVGVPQD